MFQAIQNAVGGAFDNVVEAVQDVFGGKRERDDEGELPTKRIRGWEPKIQKAARKQLEFYFSDSNYRRDRFMQSKAEAPGADGFITIDTLLTFNKLCDITTNPEVVAVAAETSAHLILSSDRKAISRARPLPNKDDHPQRTLVVEGFEEGEENVSIDSVSKLFSEYGKVIYVRLRRDSHKRFKGSAFVEFNKREHALSALKAKVAYAGKSLRTCMLEDYLSEQRKEKAHHVTESRSSYEEGLVIKVDGIPAEGLPWQDVKDAMMEYGQVAFVQISNGSSTGFARMNDPASTKSVIEAVGKSGLHVNTSEKEEVGEPNADEKEISTVVLSVSLPSQEEEKAFWAERRLMGAKSPGGRGRSRGGGRGGRRRLNPSNRQRME
eukprot:539371_1